MKCPYRVKKTTEVQHCPPYYSYPKGVVDVKTTESTDFEDCYEQACPCFDSEQRRCNYGK